MTQTNAKLPITLGHTAQNELKVIDLADAPNILIACAAGQGKSQIMKTMIESLKAGSELKLMLINPNGEEFSEYADAPGYAVISDAAQAEVELHSLCEELEHRYELILKSKMKNIASYNLKNPEMPMPYVVMIADYADLLADCPKNGENSQQKGITRSIIRLAQKGRAAGIHVILSTEKLSPEAIPDAIKINFPVRIVLSQASTDQLNKEVEMLCLNGLKTENIKIRISE